MHILIVNINNLKYTQDLIFDLNAQTNQNFKLTIVDQNSVEAGTREFYQTLSCNVIYNLYNVPLNHVWNAFYENNKDEYLCFLNNDMRITNNFVDNTINILKHNKDVGIVIHSTNHPQFKKAADLNYVILNEKILQGWDFTIRRECYSLIPKQLKIYWGDNYLFEMTYQNNYKVAMCLSSPVIHYQGESTKYIDMKVDDTSEYAKLNLPIGLKHCVRYTNIKPTYKKFD